MPRKLVSQDSAPIPPAPRRAPVRRAKQNPAPKIASEIQVSAAQETATVSSPSRDEIARLAYAFWEARGFAIGSPEEDWLRAERELMGSVTVQ
jgi:hypothetical protein